MSVSNSLSLQVQERFEQRYRGRRMRWTGVLRSVRSYAFDLVFGTDEVVVAHRHPSGLIGSSAAAPLAKGVIEYFYNAESKREAPLKLAREDSR